MKAMRFHEYGDPDVLRAEEVEVPVPGPGEVRIRVAATAFNPVDAGIRGGYLQDPFPVVLPHVPGIDVAGTIDALGANVTERHIGDRVIGFLPMVADGAAAEYVLAPAEILADAVSSPLDVILNLAPIAPSELGALARLVRPGRTVLSTVPTAVPDETSGVATVAVFARSDAGQLADLVAMIDAGELHVDVSERLPLSELPAVHARSDAGALPGKVVLVPAAA